MDEIGLATRVRCFYLGLLPRTTDKAGLAALLRAFGKVLRLRLARNKGEDTCKGYGYAYIELFCSEVQLAAGLLAGNPPVYAKEIRGPKHLGAEHTKTLRRCVKVIPAGSECARKQILNHLSQFGCLELEVSECAGPSLPDTGQPRDVKSLFAMFSDAEAISRLTAARNPSDNQSLAVLTFPTFVGMQESGLDSWEFPFFVKLHCRDDAHSLDNSRLDRESKETVHLNPACEVKNVAKMAKNPVPEHHGSPVQDLHAERKKLRPTMNFQGKRLACTINSNQLFKYSRALKQLHTHKNLRYNLRIAPSNLERSTEETT